MVGQVQFELNNAMAQFLVLIVAALTCSLTINLAIADADSYGATSTKPGFKGRITQSGLDYLRDVGLQILKQEMEHLDLPDIEGNADVPLVGKITYQISGLHINSFSISSSSLTTKANIGVVLQARGVSLSLSGHWHYKNHGWIHLSDSGTFDGSISGASLGLTLRIGMGKSGQPTISSTSQDCSFNVGSVHVKLHGGASWLYNLFDGKINKAIASSLNSKTCSMIVEEVNTDLQKELAKLKTEAPIDDRAVIDYAFVAPPMFSGHIDSFHKGEVFPRNKPHTEAPYPVPTIPQDTDVSRHVFIWITDYLFETAGYVYYKSGFFVYNVTQDKLPPGDYSLNTSSLALRLALPNVYKKYPNMLLQVDAKATAPPAVNISAKHLNASAQMDLDFLVTLPNKTLVYLFTLNATVYGSTLLGCNGSNLTWKSNFLKVEVDLKRSAIGKFDLKYLTDGIGFVLKLKLLPWLNEEGKKGLPLPNGPNIKLEKPVIKQGKDFIKLGADVLYIPSKESA